ncbi:MAG: UPF0182 family protein [Acidimicrobiales bacterium]
MRAPSDLPRSHRRRFSNRGRAVLAVAAAAAVVLVLSLRGISRFYTDYLWFESLRLSSVWGGILRARLALGLIFTGLFFLLLWVNLLVADRTAPRVRPAAAGDDLFERYHDLVGHRTTVLRTGVAAMFAVIAGAGVSQQWQSWILFTNGVSFGQTDRQFGRDIGFYVFQLPFLSFLANWLFAAFVIVLIVVVVAHYLNGGIRPQNPQQRFSPQVKAHLSVLLAALATTQAAKYWLRQFELTLSTRGFVNGATSTDVKAQLPATQLLLVISLFAVALFVYNIWQRGWVLPTVAVGLWLFVSVMMGSIYPAIYQRWRVQPDESTRERPYIARNIEATRAAMGLDKVVTKAFPADGELTKDDLVDHQDTLNSNIPLLDAVVVKDSFEKLQAGRAFFRFGEGIDVDRYVLGGQRTQMVLAARNLNPAQIPQKSWEGQHLAYTHGYGVAMAPTNKVVEGGPEFVVGDVPVTVDPAAELTSMSGEPLELKQPRIYFGERIGAGYAIVHTQRNEVDYVDDQQATVTSRYEGSGGVGMSSFVRRAAFALRFNHIYPLISDFITPESRILYVRDVRDRVATIAPFLQFDADPYPVIVDGGVKYLVDAYTTTDRYPYAQRADVSDLPAGSDLRGRRLNYIRNSVKAVVDAYDGRVDMYVVPGADGEIDPIARAYQKAFPSLFRGFDEMPAALREHLKYPSELFQVQTAMWGRYHITDAGAFYESSNWWAVPPAVARTVAKGETGATRAVSGTVGGTTARPRDERMAPNTLMLRLPGGDAPEFVTMRPFVPHSEGDQLERLTGFMVAKSDPSRYGELEVYEVAGAGVDGPANIDPLIKNDVVVSRELTLLNAAGSEVEFGNLLLIPVKDSIVWVRTMYVRASSGKGVPEVKNVVVVHRNNVKMRPTLQEALLAVFAEEGDAPPLTSAGAGGGGQAPSNGAARPTPTTTAPRGPGEMLPNQELAARAAALLRDAEDALRAGDLGAYQAKVEQARHHIEQLNGQLNQPPAEKRPGEA